MAFLRGMLRATIYIKSTIRSSNTFPYQRLRKTPSTAFYNHDRIADPSLHLASCQASGGLELEKGTLQRVKTRVVGLDERLDGGIPAGYIVLVSGPAGSLKSSFAYRIMYHEALERKAKGLYVSMEQSKDSLSRQVESLGLEPEKAKSLRVVDMRELRRTFKGTEGAFDWLPALGSQLRRYKEEVGCDLIAVDSLNALYALTELREPRRQIFDFFENLRDIGATTFLVAETPRERDGFGPYQVEEFLSDGIVHLRMREVEVGLTTSVRRYIGVVKLRGVNHDLDYYPLLVDRGQFEIVGE
jgi:KaiC/GvpD/RAD55 family RecA-like ATPase